MTSPLTPLPRERGKICKNKLNYNYFTVLLQHEVIDPDIISSVVVVRGMVINGDLYSLYLCFIIYQISLQWKILDTERQIRW
jgi:hypothetical protein